MSDNLNWFVSIPRGVEDILSMIRNRYNTEQDELPKSRWFETEQEAMEFAVLTRLKTGRECKVYHKDNNPESAYNQVRQLLKTGFKND